LFICINNYEASHVHDTFSQQDLMVFGQFLNRKPLPNFILGKPILMQVTQSIDQI